MYGINDNLTEIQRELLLIEESMDNAYNILTKKKTIDELIDEKGDENGVWLPSQNENQLDVIEEVIAYFSDKEEYEKCAELVKAKKDKARI
tara:strand:+ start:377 stop:649 length:273 start_codon:yes stop_codon:yes gene_type:complete